MLHALEHFGLGRYGDPIEANGVALGLTGLAKLLQPEGLLYLSCPLGPDIVHFNAHRSLHPRTIAKLAAEQGLLLERCWLFDQSTKSFDPPQTSLPEVDLTPNQTLGIYVFRKPGNNKGD